MILIKSDNQRTATRRIRSYDKPLKLIDMKHQLSAESIINGDFKDKQDKKMQTWS